MHASRRGGMVATPATLRVKAERRREGWAARLTPQRHCHPAAARVYRNVLELPPLPEVMNRAVPVTDGVRSLDGHRNVRLGAANRLVQRLAARQQRRDARGERTAGPVGAGRLNPPGRQLQELIAVEED